MSQDACIITFCCTQDFYVHACIQYTSLHTNSVQQTAPKAADVVYSSSHNVSCRILSWAVGVSSKVTCFSSEDILALSTIAQNQVICITSFNKTSFFTTSFFFLNKLMQFKGLLLLRNHLEQTSVVCHFFLLEVVEEPTSAWGVSLHTRQRGGRSRCILGDKLSKS